jgi:Xaa-Pro aminopeptidase
MTVADRSLFVSRHVRVRDVMGASGVDALLVTHLPNVRYLTGLNSTDGAAIILRASLLLVVDFRYVTAAREAVQQLGDDGVQVVPVERSYDEAIVEILRLAAAARIGVEGAWLSVSRFNTLSARLAAAAPFPIQPDQRSPVLVPTERVVERARIVKDDREVLVLREAGRRLSLVARGLPGLVRAGRSEQEIAGEIERAMRDAGFSRPAFETIVASGPNSAFPHARPTGRRLAAGEPCVLDFGGVYDGYCVDLTRTVQLGRAATSMQRLFDAVSEAHDTAIAAVRPGIRPSEIDRAARDVLVRHGLGQAFGHGTGHGLGLEIHEEPRIGQIVAGRPDEPVEPGMVFTIEPGAYVPGLGGVRIEDDVLVTPGGCELLTDVPIWMEIL